MSAKSPTFLIKDGSGTYYFRIVIPKQFRLRFPDIPREFRRSLNTHYKRDALCLARMWWSELQPILEMGKKDNSNFDAVDFLRKSLAKNKLKRELRKQGYQEENQQAVEQAGKELLPNMPIPAARHQDPSTYSNAPKLS